MLKATNTVEVAVGAASVQFGLTMVEGSAYQVCSTTAAWCKVGSNPTAVGRTSGNVYLPPNVPVTIACEIGSGATKLAIIQDAAGGFASLTAAIE